MDNTFCKSERLRSKLVIDRLFTPGKSSSMAVYPLRVVYMQIPAEDAPSSMDGTPASILISVPKKRFHHAVDRNRMKRQIREAYRTSKATLWKALEGKDYKIAVAFIAITDEEATTPTIQKSVRKALRRIAEKMA